MNSLAYKAVICLFALASSAAMAAGSRQQAEASMIVSGQVELSPSGQVLSYSIDHQDQLPEGVVALIQQNVPVWHFNFTEVPAQPVRETMHLRIAAKKADHDQEVVRIESAEFDDASVTEDEKISFKTIAQPEYPKFAMAMPASGSVVLLIQVGRDGTVEHVSAEQTNLRIVTDGDVMNRCRKEFAEAAVKAAKRWTFNVPTKGAEAKAPFFLVRTTYSFVLLGSGQEGHSGRRYGQWDVYVPGPRQNVPWIQNHALLSDASDSTPDGELHRVGGGVTLTGTSG